jgi:uncharacterized protein YodC (DUF2158 family)
MTDDPTAFKVGDVVRLKSLGHVMTVASIDESSVTCDWSLRGDIKSKSFAAAELEKADPPPTLGQIFQRVEELKERQDRRGDNRRPPVPVA